MNGILCGGTKAGLSPCARGPRWRRVWEGWPMACPRCRCREASEAEVHGEGGEDAVAELDGGAGPASCPPGSGPLLRGSGGGGRRGVRDHPNLTQNTQPGSYTIVLNSNTSFLCLSGVSEPMKYSHKVQAPLSGSQLCTWPRSATCDLTHERIRFRSSGSLGVFLFFFVRGEGGNIQYCAKALATCKKSSRCFKKIYPIDCSMQVKTKSNNELLLPPLHL